MKRPLAGYTIGVTADRRSDEQISLLAGRGATCIHGPTIRTHPLRPEDEIAKVTTAFLEDPPDVVIFTTAIGLRGWLEAADALRVGEQLRAALAGCRVLARGPKARGAAVTAELAVEGCGPTSTSAGMVDQLRPTIRTGQRVAVQLDGSPDQPLIADLESLGAEVLPIPVYRWTLPVDFGAAESLVKAVAERRVDAITFTARPAVLNFGLIAERLGLFDEAIRALDSQVAAFCVGPVCASAATELGLTNARFPERHRLGAMVMQITEELMRQNTAVDIGGHAVVLQGSMVVVGDNEPGILSFRERQVLEALLTKPSAVLSKDALLRQVWRSTDSDPHLVEVTVGRLRKRLGPAGMGIETVMRRGYRVSPT